MGAGRPIGEALSRRLTGPGLPLSSASRLSNGSFSLRFMINSPTRSFSNFSNKKLVFHVHDQSSTKQIRTLARLKPQASFEFLSTRRPFSGSASNYHEHLTPPKAGEELHITFVDKEGREHEFEVAAGDNLLDIALENDLEMEGACGGSCACSTCHVVVESEDFYNKMAEPDDDENDMLDLAFGLTETSRLGCQVKMKPDLDGLRVRLPAMTRNLQASDFSKKT